MSGSDTGKSMRWACFAAPVLIGIDQVAALWAKNAWEVTAAQGLRTLAAVALIAIAGPAILSAAKTKGLFRYNLFTLLFYVAVHWDDFKDSARLFGDLVTYGKPLAYAAFGLLAIALILWAYLRSRVFARFAVLFAALLLGSTVLRMSPQLAAATASGSPPPLKPVPLPLDRVTAVEELPDIVYIVPDRYGGPSVLKEFFGFDNAPFVEALRARGFYVAAQARANYPNTFQSLASTLNMQHLDGLAEAMGPDSGDRRPVYRLIEDNLVVKTLKDLGYRYVHLGSWWDPTKHNPNADIEYLGSGNVFRTALSNLERALVVRTVFDELLDRLEKGGECLRLRQQLSFLKNAASDPDRPTFVFAHLLIPHSPIVMDAQGRCIEPIDYPKKRVSWSDFQKAYAGYVSYLNDELLAIFDARIAASRRPLIFVIQADEGPFPRRLRESGGNMDWFTATEAELRMKYGILNAIYFPDGDYGRLTEALTPVNNFRLIFSKILNVDLPLLEDRSFVFENARRVYNFKEIRP